MHEPPRVTVVRNVADIAEPHSSSRNGRSMRVWTGDQLRTFLEAIDDHDPYPSTCSPRPPARSEATSPAVVKWRRWLRSRHRRRLADPPRLISRTFQRFTVQIDPTHDPAPRPSPHPRDDRAPTERSPQGRQRTPRALQHCLHHGRLPHARQASRSWSLVFGE